MESIEMHVWTFLVCIYQKQLKRTGKPQIRMKKIGKIKTLKDQVLLGPIHMRVGSGVGLGGKTWYRYFMVKQGLARYLYWWCVGRAKMDKDVWNKCNNCLLKKKSWMIRASEQGRRVGRENGDPITRLISLPINKSF